MTIRVSFRDFWPNFRPEDFFLPLIRRATGVAVTTVPGFSTCDLEIVSVFPRVSLIERGLKRGKSLVFRKGNQTSSARLLTTFPSRYAKASIWYTGECIQPPRGLWTRTWSFEPDCSPHGNYYVPIWWLQFPELVNAEPARLPDENRSGIPITLAETLRSRNLGVASRSKFCCAFLNWNPPIREKVVRTLREVGEVDVYGLLTGNVARKKVDVAHDYRFMFCGENTVHPGYVTEKIFDAWALGCVPIWLGDDREGFLNPKAYLQVTDYPDEEALVDAVRLVNSSAKLREEIVSAPLLLRPPDLEPLFADLRSLLMP